ncbi:MAG: hypothetical protein AVDCRST_MAG47-501, partial [uncultured Nocardioidaceae bacterium]
AVEVGRGPAAGCLDDRTRLAHDLRLPQRLRALGVVEAGAGVRRRGGRPEPPRPRGVHDPRPADRPPPALHRGAGGQAGQEPDPPRPLLPHRVARRGAGHAARPGRHRGRRPPGQGRSWNGLGGPGRPGGQRVLHRPVAGRARPGL